MRTCGVVPAGSFGAALQYFTGSKDHSVACRKIAIEKGLKLNEYGVFRGSRSIAGRSEEEVYAALGLPWIAPELREDRGEIAAALAGKLPHILDYGSLRGDLQTQTELDRRRRLDRGDGPGREATRASNTSRSPTIRESLAMTRRLGREKAAPPDGGHRRDQHASSGAFGS